MLIVLMQRNDVAAISLRTEKLTMLDNFHEKVSIKSLSRLEPALNRLVAGDRVGFD